jgi:antitoxin YefM
MPVATLDISEARKQLNTIDQTLRSKHVIEITRHNRKVFALIDLEYLETVQETIEVLSDPEAMQMLQDSLKDLRAGRVHTQSDVEKKLG